MKDANNFFAYVAFICIQITLLLKQTQTTSYGPLNANGNISYGQVRNQLIDANQSISVIRYFVGTTLTAINDGISKQIKFWDHVNNGISQIISYSAASCTVLTNIFQGKDSSDNDVLIVQTVNCISYYDLITGIASTEYLAQKLNLKGVVSQLGNSILLKKSKQIWMSNIVQLSIKQMCVYHYDTYAIQMIPVASNRTIVTLNAINNENYVAIVLDNASIEIYDVNSQALVHAMPTVGQPYYVGYGLDQQIYYVTPSGINVHSITLTSTPPNDAIQGLISQSSINSLQQIIPVGGSAYIKTLNAITVSTQCKDPGNTDEYCIILYNNLLATDIDLSGANKQDRIMLSQNGDAIQKLVVNQNTTSIGLSQLQIDEQNLMVIALLDSSKVYSFSYQIQNPSTCQTDQYFKPLQPNSDKCASICYDQSATPYLFEGVCSPNCGIGYQPLVGLGICVPTYYQNATITVVNTTVANTTNTTTTANTTVTVTSIPIITSNNSGNISLVLTKTADPQIFDIQVISQPPTPKLSLQDLENLSKSIKLQLEKYNKNTLSTEMTFTIDDTTNQIQMKLNYARPVVGMPLLTLSLDPALTGFSLIPNNNISIYVNDFYNLTDQQKQSIAQTGTAKVIGAATLSTISALSASSSGSSAFKSLTLLGLIQMINYASVYYPPNVQEVFNDMKQFPPMFILGGQNLFDEADEDFNCLPKKIQIISYSPYMINNFGEALIQLAIVIFVGYLIGFVYSRILRRRTMKTMTFWQKVWNAIAIYIQWNLIYIIIMSLQFDGIFYTMLNIFHPCLNSDKSGKIFALGFLLLIFNILLPLHIYFLIKTADIIEIAFLKKALQKQKEEELILQEGNDKQNQTTKPQPMEEKKERQRSDQLTGMQGWIIKKVYMPQKFIDKEQFVAKFNVLYEEFKDVYFIQKCFIICDMLRVFLLAIILAAFSNNQMAQTLLCMGVITVYYVLFLIFRPNKSKCMLVITFIVESMIVLAYFGAVLISQAQQAYNDDYLTDSELSVTSLSRGNTIVIASLAITYISIFMLLVPLFFTFKRFLIFIFRKRQQNNAKQENFQDKKNFRMRLEKIRNENLNRDSDEQSSENKFSRSVILSDNDNDNNKKVESIQSENVSQVESQVSIKQENQNHDHDEEEGNISNDAFQDNNNDDNLQHQQRGSYEIQGESNFAIEHQEDYQAHNSGNSDHYLQ